MSSSTRCKAEAAKRRVEIRALRLVAAATLNRALTPAEDTALAQALRAVRAAWSRRDAATRRAGPARPATAGVGGSLVVRRALARARRATSTLALDRLCEGDAAGMFDGETSPGVALDGAARRARPLRRRRLLGDLDPDDRGDERGCKPRSPPRPTRTIASGSSSSTRPGACSRTTPPPRRCVDTVKHSRAYGIQTIIVTHRIGDLAAAGDEGTRTSRIAEGLLSDAETKVVFAQAPDQVALARERLGLTTTEAEILPHLATRRSALAGRHPQLPRPPPPLTHENARSATPTHACIRTAT